jgi:undecaprenyl diphosphate synthase
LAALGVRIRWAGRRPRLWRSVISQLQDAEEYTRGNDRLTLQFCVNYGGRAELVDAARAIADEVAAGTLKPAKIDERTIAAHLDEPDLPDVDLFIRTSGEQRTSNFLLWQSAYSELVFLPIYWPEFDHRALEEAILEFQRRERRFGGLAARTAS